jgi:hypothetical protein
VDGPDRDLQDAGDLIRRKLAEVVEDEDRSMVDRRATNPPLELVPVDHFAQRPRGFRSVLR